MRFERDGKSFLAIDTPGVRKRKSLENDIEVYGMFPREAEHTPRDGRADVLRRFAGDLVRRQATRAIHLRRVQAVHFCRQQMGPGQEAGDDERAVGEYLSQEFPTLTYFPVAFVTAKDAVNIRQVVNLAQNIAKQNRIRVSTSKINAVLRAAVLANRPPMRAQRQPKVF